MNQSKDTKIKIQVTETINKKGTSNTDKKLHKLTKKRKYIYQSKNNIKIPAKNPNINPRRYMCRKNQESKLKLKMDNNCNLNLLEINSIRIKYMLAKEISVDI